MGFLQFCYRYPVLRIRSILDRIRNRIRPTNLRPDPDPACNITGGEKKLKTHSGKAPWAKLEALRKAGYKDFNSSDKIYMVRNYFKSTVVWKNRSDLEPDPVWNKNSGSGSDQKGPDPTESGSTTLPVPVLKFSWIFSAYSSGNPNLQNSNFFQTICNCNLKWIPVWHKIMKIIGRNASCKY